MKIKAAITQYKLKILYFMLNMINKWVKNNIPIEKYNSFYFNSFYCDRSILRREANLLNSLDKERETLSFRKMFLLGIRKFVVKHIYYLDRDNSESIVDYVFAVNEKARTSGRRYTETLVEKFNRQH